MTLRIMEYDAEPLTDPRQIWYIYAIMDGWERRLR